MPLLSIEEASRPPSGRFGRSALWALGFRPFYLLASGFAAVSILLWALQATGRLGVVSLAGPVWHAHEMLFGFALAVIVGFLFTAGQNWTGRPTPTGRPLMALAVLWLLARLLALTPFTWAGALANVAFAWSAAFGLAVPILRARNRRNFFFIVLLVLLGAASGLIHLTALGIVEMPAGLALQFALDLVLFIVAVMAGRVIPMFTNNGIGRAVAVRHSVIERIALGSVLLLAAADAAGLQGAPLIAVAAVAAAAHAIRWLAWRPWATSRVPLVWVLHLAYAWLPIHLGLRALGELGLVAPTLAIHALTTGAVGIMIIGMMTRTARGHTGLPLRADRCDVGCYLLVAGAALLRVGLPLVAPGLAVQAILGSAALWSAGFGLYLVRYWPRLTRPRRDGKPG